MRRTDTLVADNLSVLDQARDLVGRLDARVYSAVEGMPITSGAGAHLRHCLDFYDCLLEGLTSGRVDYNRRERDELTATDPERAVARIDATSLAIEGISHSGLFTHLLVRADGSGDQSDPTLWGRSSVERELQFLLSHTIHHFALIALIVRLQGIEPGPEFGVAPSTLAYWRSAS
jgi:hypothetical protein